MSEKKKQSQEETKSYRPKTPGQNKNRAPIANEAEKPANKPRPKTAKPQKDNEQKVKQTQPEEESKRDNRDHPRGEKHHKRNEHHDQDVNSWKYKFHNREPKKYDKIVFTADTEIPSLPPKEARLKQP